MAACRKWATQMRKQNEQQSRIDIENTGNGQNSGKKRPEDLTHRTFGKLYVLGLSDKRGPRGSISRPLWECRCECGAITYKHTDILKNDEVSMCAACAAKYASEKARQAAGYVGGTQVTKIREMSLTAANNSGVRGVVYEKSSKRWRARLCFRGKNMSFGSFERFEDAVAARKAAEKEIFGAFLNELDNSENT